MTRLVARKEHYDFIRIAMNELLAKGVKECHQPQHEARPVVPLAGAPPPAAEEPVMPSADAEPAKLSPTAAAEPAVLSPAVAAGPAVLSPAAAAEPATPCEAAPGCQPDVVAAAPAHPPPHQQTISRLMERHHPSEIPPTGKKGRTTETLFRLLGTRSEKGSASLFPAVPGQPGLCAAPCFGIYHTQYDFGQLK